MIEHIASNITSQVNELCATWCVPREIGQDIAKLALFDIILYIGKIGNLSGDGIHEGKPDE